MDERKIELIRQLGLNESDFIPKEKTDAETIEELKAETEELRTVNAMLSDTLDMLLTEIIPNLTEEEI